MTGKIGYGKGEIEPRIAPLVEAVRGVGFVTFSSCEGHENIDDQGFSRFANVAFYAHEDEALHVHSFFLRYRPQLICSWCFRGSIVHHKESDRFRLGWTLENCGFIQQVSDEAEFVTRTVQAGWDTDIPMLIEMFAEIAGARQGVA